jgi:hypothetical protein
MTDLYLPSGKQASAVYTSWLRHASRAVWAGLPITFIDARPTALLAGAQLAGSRKLHHSFEFSTADHSAHLATISKRMVPLYGPARHDNPLEALTVPTVHSAAPSSPSRKHHSAF